MIVLRLLRRWAPLTGLMSSALAVAVSSGCCAVGRCPNCGEWESAAADCEPRCDRCQECEQCNVCCERCRPRLGARLGGRWHDLRVAASTPRPEAPPMTNLHPVPTAPVFGARLSGREAGLLATGEMVGDGLPSSNAAPQPLPVLVPSPSESSGETTEHINRLPQQPVRRVSHQTSVIQRTSRSASELHFKR